MKTREELIKFYEQRLEKVKIAYPYDTESLSWDNERNLAYVRGAEKELKAVKNGREW